MNPFPGDEREVFDVSVAFGAGTVLVAVRGEVDLVTARALDAVMATLAESGRRRVVLDLGACTFMGIDGLSITASCAAALAPSGGRLVVRWASSVVERLIEIVGITDVDIEPTGARSAGAVAALSQPSGGTELGPLAKSSSTLTSASSRPSPPPKTSSTPLSVWWSRWPKPQSVGRTGSVSPSTGRVG